MKIVKIKRNFRRLANAAFGTSARGVFSNLKSNPTYPEAAPLVTAATPVLDKFDIANQKAEDTHDRNWINQRNDARAAVSTVLDQLADTAQAKTPGNSTLLATTGFDLTSQPKPAGDMPKPASLAIHVTNGLVKIQVPSNPKCISYVFEFIALPNPENDWAQKILKRSTLSLTGLIPGTQYSFRCAYVGTKGQGSWSDVVTRFIGD